MKDFFSKLNIGGSLTMQEIDAELKEIKAYGNDILLTATYANFLRLFDRIDNLTNRIDKLETRIDNMKIYTMKNND